MKKLFSVIIVFLILVLGLSSCKNKNKGDENKGDQNIAAEENVIFSETVDAYLVLADGIDPDVTYEIEEKYLINTNKLIGKNSPSDTAKPHEIVVGNTDRAVSKKAYTRLSRLEKLGEHDVGFVIYSDGASVAIAFDEDKFGTNGALIDSVEHFVNNYMQNATLSLENGVAYETVFDIIERQRVLDEVTLEDRWANKLNQITQKFGGNRALAEETVAALREMNDLLTKDGDIASWIANLYDPENGGFYYSNSARDNLGYLPDLESTTQALGIIEDLLTIDYSGSLADFLGEEIVSSLISFAKGMQDPDNGYFYHPQWGKELTDQKLNRRGRDVGNAVRILQRFGSAPTYDTPTGVKGDGIKADGTPVALSSLSSPFGKSTVSAVSYVISANAEDANVSTHMRTREAFEAYLSSLDINGSYYAVGNTLESQADQFVHRDKTLAERGENYRLADICEEWMTKHQNPETGLWNLDGKTGYEEVNGLLKLGSTYSKLKKKIPNAAKGIQAAIDCMLGDEEVTIICDIFNTWYVISLVSSNVSSYGSPSEYSEVLEIKNNIYENYPAMIRATTKKVAVFKKLDGSYSFTRDYSSHMSQGMPVAVQNTVEGDVNSTMIASISIPGTIYSYLGIGAVPIFTPADRMAFKSILDDMGFIIKNEMPAAEPIDFEDEKRGTESDYVNKIINSSGTVLVEKRPDGKGNALHFKSSSDGAGVGSDEVQFPTATNWYGAPCNILDLDMCVLPETDDTYFAQLSLYPNMYMIGIHKNGDTIQFTEESSWTASNSFTHDLGVTAKLGEWFNIRIEFYTGGIDDIRIKVYFNGDCIVVSNNYFDSSALKLTGDAKAPLQYDFGRLLIMSNANGSVLLDNIIVDQTFEAYEPEVDPLDQPLRNFDAPNAERVSYNDISISNGETYVIETNSIGSEANSASLGFKLLVDESSEAGAKYAINFKEFKNKNADLISLHLLVKETGGEKYAVFCESALGATGIEYDYIKIPLGKEVEVEIYFFFDESCALVFIDGELVGINGNVVSGQRRFYYGNVEIKSLTSSITSCVHIDGLYSERIKNNYEKLSAPAVERVTHEFDKTDGLVMDGINAAGGVLGLSASSGGFVKIPVNSRSNISSFGLASLGIVREKGNGSFTVALKDKYDNIIAAFDVVATKDGVSIYEFTENGRYETPLTEIVTSAFTLSVEYSAAKESFNILIGDKCVTVSSLNYTKGSTDYSYEYLVISCDESAPFSITNAIAETSAALFKPYKITLANEDSSSRVMTYETSNFASLPSKITKSFVTSGSDLRVRESDVFGEISKVLEFSTRSGGNDILTFAPTKSFSGGNAISFETDMMISAENGAYVDIEPMSSGTRAYQLRLYSPKEGGIIIASSKDFSKKIAREGEWFKFRFEYTKTAYDYNYDGKADILFRLYINGELITEGYTPYTGDGFEASTVTKVRLFTHSGTVADYYFDNTVYEQFDMEYDAPAEYVPGDPTVLDYDSGILPSQISVTLASEKSDYNIVEDTVADAISKVLKFTTSSGGNDYLTVAPTRTAETFNAVALETDFKIVTESELYVDVQPMAEGKTAYQVRLNVKPSGGKITASSSDFSTVIAKEDEWFKLRIEYANTEYDYNYDGKLDVIVRVYVNGVLVEEGYTPYYETGFDEEKVSVFRFFTHNGSVGDIFFENTVFEQFTMAYEEPPVYVPEDNTVLSFESGVMPSQVSFNKSSDGGDCSIVDKTVGDEVSKVLKFTTSVGGNDYMNVKRTEVLESSNGIRFETDIMIEANSKSQFAIEPLTSGSSRAFRLIVTATPDGNVTVYSESESAVSFTLGKVGEWCHLRIDYMSPGIDYNLDGSADILYKIYVGNSETPVAVGYAPYRAGEIYDPTSLVSVRFFAFADANCSVLLDNTSLKQVNLTPDEAPEVEEPDEPDDPTPPVTPDEPEVSPETPEGPGHQEGENIYDPDAWGKH